MSVSIDYSCLRDFKNDCCCFDGDCKKQDCISLSQRFLVFAAVATISVVTTTSMIAILYYGGVKQKVEEFNMVIALFWIFYAVLHVMLIGYAAINGYTSIFPKVQTAFPKTKPIFLYWIYVALFFWYFVIWLPKIIFLVNNNLEMFHTTQWATFLCFMVHFFVEFAFYLTTCCIKFEQKKISKESTFN